jgi:uncharacterized protein YndB with AHSA1/START domain
MIKPSLDHSASRMILKSLLERYEEAIMTAIKDQIRIETTPEKAYDALTTQRGYNGWWSKDCVIGAKAGDEARLTFDKAGTKVNMKYRIDRIDAKSGIRWTCTAHDAPPWVGTTLEWAIQAEGAKSVTVALTHDGWEGAPPEPVIGGWKHFLGSMKKYLETGTGEPW